MEKANKIADAFMSMLKHAKEQKKKKAAPPPEPGTEEESKASKVAKSIRTATGGGNK